MSQDLSQMLTAIERDDQKQFCASVLQNQSYLSGFQYGILDTLLGAAASLDRMNLFKMMMAQLSNLPTSDQINTLLSSSPLVSHQAKFDAYSQLILEQLTLLTPHFKNIKTITLCSTYLRKEAEVFVKQIPHQAEELANITFVHSGFLRYNKWVLLDLTQSSIDRDKYRKISLSPPLLIEFITTLLTNMSIIHCNLFARDETKQLMKLLKLILDRNQEIQKARNKKNKNEIYNCHVTLINDAIDEIQSSLSGCKDSNLLKKITPKRNPAYSLRDLSSFLFSQRHQSKKNGFIDEPHSENPTLTPTSKR